MTLMTDSIDDSVIEKSIVTWTPYRSDESGNVWEWEGRADATRIIVDPAAHAYIAQMSVDINSLLAENRRLREALDNAESYFANYGRHHLWCDSQKHLPAGPCNCGRDAAQLQIVATLTPP